MEEDWSSKLFGGMSRRKFLAMLGAAGVTLATYKSVANAASEPGVIAVKETQPGEDVFAYLSRVKGSFDQKLYQQVIGAANDFKEGDQAIGLPGRRRIGELPVQRAGRLFRHA